MLSQSALICWYTIQKISIDLKCQQISKDDLTSKWLVGLVASSWMLIVIRRRTRLPNAPEQIIPQVTKAPAEARALVVPSFRWAHALAFAPNPAAVTMAAGHWDPTNLPGFPRGLQIDPVTATTCQLIVTSQMWCFPKTGNPQSCGWFTRWLINVNQLDDNWGVPYDLWNRHIAIV